MCASTPYLTGWTRIPLFGLPPSFHSCIPLPSSYLSLLSLHHHIPLIVCPLSLSFHQSISASSFLPPLSSLLQFLKLICTLQITSSTLSPSTLLLSSFFYLTPPITPLYIHALSLTFPPLFSFPNCLYIYIIIYLI